MKRNWMIELATCTLLNVKLIFSKQKKSYTHNKQEEKKRIKPENDV